MENATKALEMAASVLIGMLILGALVFAYTRMHEVKQAEEDSLLVEQASGVNKKFEVYNRNGLYGSEILSLANLIIDYNSREGAEGYTTIDLSVTINEILDAQVYTATTYNAQQLMQCYDALATLIANANTNVNGKNISYWANTSLTELRNTFTTTTSPTYNEMQAKITTYKTLFYEQEDMSRKVFDVVKVEYDKNGRIVKMQYKEE